MQLYAERPIRRTAQLVSDLLALLLVVFAVWLGTSVYDEVMRLRAPGDGLVDAGTGLRGTFDSAASSAGGIPLIGDALAKALHGGSAVGTKFADAGRWQIEAVESLAWWMAAIIIALPVLALVVTWLPLRWHFTRRATAAAALRDLGDEGLDLLALRALTTQPLQRLAKSGRLATGWRERDQDVIQLLAGHELASHGLTSTQVREGHLEGL
jgi:TRAP-type C4-dicarboxylate transport system permease small subunit